MDIRLKFEPVRFDGRLALIDQRKLPGQLMTLRLLRAEEVWHAIREMVVRGAPAIGIAAAYGGYLGIANEKLKTRKEFLTQFQKVSSYLKTARPTAVNLAWALDKIQRKSPLPH